MNDRAYDYWRAALAGDTSAWDTAEGKCGFYRLRFSKRDPWQPLAIYQDEEGREIARIGCDLRPISILAVWQMAAQNPVTEAQYRHALAHEGEWWDSVRAHERDPEAGRVIADVARAEPIGPLPAPGRFGGE